MEITCVIPTCDRRDYLNEALNSVLRQTRPPEEIIIVNNGKERLELPPEHDSRIKVYNIIPYAGVAQARNFGASVARHDYVAFLDDDDMWSNNYLENVAKAFLEGATCVLSRQDKLEDGKISFYQSPHGKINLENLLVRNPGAGGPNVAVKRNAFFEAGGFDPKLPPSEDKSMILEMLLKEMSVKTLPDNSVIVRFHSGPRLTNHDRIIEGISQFIRKYGHLMNREQLVTNWVKIYMHKYQSGNKKIIPTYAALKIILKIIKINKKIKKYV